MISKHQIQRVWRFAGWRGTGLPNPSRETKFSGTNADREIFTFPVQLTTCRTGNLTRLIHTFSCYIDVTIHTYTRRIPQLYSSYLGYNSCNFLNIRSSTI